MLSARVQRGRYDPAHLKRPSSMDILVFIPAQAALVSYVGCALITLATIAVTMFGKRRESLVERHLKAAHLGSILTGNSLVSRNLLHFDVLQLEGEQISGSQSLRCFELTGLLLQHRTNENILIQMPRPPPLSLSQ